MSSNTHTHKKKVTKKEERIETLFNAFSTLKRMYVNFLSYFPSNTPETQLLEYISRYLYRKKPSFISFLCCARKEKAEAKSFFSSKNWCSSIYFRETCTEIVVFRSNRTHTSNKHSQNMMPLHYNPLAFKKIYILCMLCVVYA